MNTYKNVVSRLHLLIEKMKNEAYLYCNHPAKDFIRNQKLDCSTMMKLLISMEGGHLQQELFEYFS